MAALLSVVSSVYGQQLSTSDGSTLSRQQLKELRFLLLSIVKAVITASYGVSRADVAALLQHLVLPPPNGDVFLHQDVQVDLLQLLLSLLQSPSPIPGLLEQLQAQQAPQVLLLLFENARERLLVWAIKVVIPLLPSDVARSSASSSCI